MTAQAQDPRDDNVAHLRVPPHSVEAEQSVLGSILLDNSALQIASDLVTAADFFRHEHRLIWHAAEDLVTDGQIADIITVFERLQSNGKADDCGGLAYLNSLCESVASARNVRNYAQIVRERSLRRQLLAASDEIAAAAFQAAGKSAPELIEDGFARMRALAAESPGRRALPMLSFEQLREQAQAVRWLVKGAILSDAVGVLFGASGTFKSYVALDLAMHVCHGLKWLGKRTQKGPVLILAAEGSTGTADRIQAWHRQRGLRIPGPDMLRVIPIPVDIVGEAWRIVETADLAGFRPALAIIDTLSQTYTGDEDKAQDMARYLRELGARLRATWRSTVLVIHHSGHAKTERPRGSSALQANTSFLLGCYRDEKELLCTLTCEHLKEGGPWEDEMFELRQQDLGTDEDGDRITQLVAYHLNSAEEVQQAMVNEQRAGRGGRNRLLLSLVQNGMEEKALRKAFNEDCDIQDTDQRRVAYFRAKKWAESKGFVEFVDGRVIMIQRLAS